MRVSPAVLVDVLDGLLQALHHLNGHAETAVLHVHGVGRVVGETHLDGTRTTEKRYAGSTKGAQEGIGETRGHCFSVQQQSLRGIAGRGIVSFGVDDDPHGFGGISLAVDVDVADALGMAHHRYSGVVLDVLDETSRATGNHEVDELVHLEQRGDVRTISDQSHHIPSHPPLRDALNGIGDDAVETGIAVLGFLATL